MQFCCSHCILNEQICIYLRQSLYHSYCKQGLGWVPRCPTRRSARARVTALYRGGGGAWWVPGPLAQTQIFSLSEAWPRPGSKLTSHTEVPGSLHNLTRSGMGWSWVFSPCIIWKQHISLIGLRIHY